MRSGKLTNGTAFEGIIQNFYPEITTDGLSTVCNQNTTMNIYF